MQRFPHTFACCQCHAHKVQCYPSRWQLRSDFGDFSNGVRHVMMICMADSCPDMDSSRNGTNTWL